MIKRCPIRIIEHVSDKYCLLGLYAPEMVVLAQPGQFVNLQIPGGNDPLLKRPFSIHKINVKEEILYILFKVIGQGTQILRQLSLGDEVEVLGPLGTGFTLVKDQNVLLIGGGIGVAPLYQLGMELQSQGNRVTTLLGLTRAEDLVLVKAIQELEPKWILAQHKNQQRNHSVERSTTDLPGEVNQTTHANHTDNRTTFDDGQEVKRQGFVTDLVAEIGTNQFDQIYICGPHPMLTALQKMLKDQLTACQFSMEEKMGCGIGLCFSCTCKVQDEEGTDGWSNERICTRGPVFRGDEVILS